MSVVSSDGKGRLGEEGGLGQRIGLRKGLLMRKNVALVPGVVVEDGTGEGDGPRGRHVCVPHPGSKIQSKVCGGITLLTKGERLEGGRLQEGRPVRSLLPWLEKEESRLTQLSGFMCCLSLNPLDMYTALSGPPTLAKELSVGLCVEGPLPLFAGVLGLRHWTPGQQWDDVLAMWAKSKMAFDPSSPSCPQPEVKAMSACSDVFHLYQPGPRPGDLAARRNSRRHEAGS